MISSQNLLYYGMINHKSYHSRSPVDTSINTDTPISRPVSALQTQIKTLLPELTALLQVHGCRDLRHLRVGKQILMATDMHKESRQYTVYQGLARADHADFGEVMIKWETASKPSDLEAVTCHDAKISTVDAVQGSLAYEVSALTAIQRAASTQGIKTDIAPTLLTVITIAANQWPHHQPLTLMMMPYYARNSLAQAIRQRPTPAEQHHWLLQTAQRLHDLHRLGWLHNDIKPSNLLLDHSGDDRLHMPHVLLTDFAAASMIAADRLGAYGSNQAGTPAYLAPERWQGYSATVQSDIYAFAILLYEVLVGMKPYRVDKQSQDPLQAWAMQHCQQPLPALPTVYQHYQSIFDKAAAKRLNQRYQSMGEVIDDLRLTRKDIKE